MGNLIFAGQIARVEQAKIDAARLTQETGNARRGSDAALASFSASLGNMRRMDAAGDAVADSAANSARRARAQTQGLLAMEIQEAEELGRAAATAGAAGTGGGSVQTYSQTVSLMNELKTQQMERQFAEVEFASSEQRGNFIKTAVAQNDSNIYRANLDYTQYIDYKKPSFLEQAIGIAGTAAATVFGGPAAGQAVMGMFEARQNLRNADIGSADQALRASLGSTLQAAQDYNALRSPSVTEEPEKPDNWGATFQFTLPSQLNYGSALNV